MVLVQTRLTLNRIDWDSALGKKKIWCLLQGLVTAGGVRKMGGGQRVDGVLTVTLRYIKG